MEEKQEWTCACGQKNSGNFCEMCGKPRPEAQPADGSNHEAMENTQPQPPVTTAMETQAQPTAQPADSVVTPEQAAEAEKAAQAAMELQQQAQQMPPLDATQSMPPVRELAPMPQQQPWQQGMPQQPMVQPQQPPYMAPPPPPGYGYGPMPPKKKHTTQILIGIVVALLIVAVGAFAYVRGAEDRYVAKCVKGEEVVTEVQNLLKETKDLNGDPDADATKDFVVRLDKAGENLDKLARDLKSSRTGSKYKDANQKLVEAVQLERSLIDDTKTVVNQPLDKGTDEVVKRVQANTKDLTERAGEIQIPKTDFATAMQLSALPDDLKAYINKKKAIEEQKRIEAERRAAEAEAARKQAIRDRQAARNQRIIDASNGVEFLATSVRRTSANRLDIDGYFYNGSYNSIQKVSSMTLNITLYNNGAQVYSDHFYFYNDMYLGSLSPKGRQNQSLWVTTNGQSIPEFDEFEVNSTNVHWTYWRNF